MFLEDALRELDRAATVIQTVYEPNARVEAENLINKWKNDDNPYQICKHILEKSSNEYLLFEAGKTLTSAVIRDWKDDFPSNEPLAKELIQFILTWALGRGSSASVAVQRRCLGVVATIVKLACTVAARKAAMERVFSNNSTLESKLKKEDLLTRSPPCAIMNIFMESVSFLLSANVPFEQTDDGVLYKQLIALTLIICLLDEFSNGPESYDVSNSLEIDLFLRGPFEQNELLKLFQMILNLTSNLLTASPDILSRAQTVVMRTIDCLDMTLNWDFLSNSLMELFRTSRENRHLRPHSSWDCVFGSEAIPHVISLLKKLHHVVRDNAAFGTKTINCLVRLSTLVLSDVVGEARVGLAVILIDQLTNWLIPETSQPISAMFPPEMNCFFASNTVTKPDAPTLRLALLHVYELPFLADFVVNLTLITGDLWSVIEKSVHNDVEFEANLRMFRQLAAFYSTVKVLILQAIDMEHDCGLLMQARNQVTVLHESVGRLCSAWESLRESLPGWSEEEEGDELPLALSNMISDRRMSTLQQMIGLMRRAVHGLQTDLFDVYLRSRLSAPIGRRNVPAASEQAQQLRDELADAEASEDEVDLDIDESDNQFHEDSLFTMSPCGLSQLSQSGAFLAQLLAERTTQLATTGRDDVEVLEDLHWLILICGHLLVTGPDDALSAVKLNCTWSSEFSVCRRLLSNKLTENGSPVDLQASLELLQESVREAPRSAEAWPLAPERMAQTLVAARLLSAVFRLLWWQCQNRLGSSQLLQDSFWFMSRFSMTFLAAPWKPRDVKCWPFIQLLADAEVGVGRECVRSLIACGQLALANWHAEPQAMQEVSTLVCVLTRHLDDPGRALDCEAWLGLCQALFGPNAVQSAWCHLQPTVLAELVDSALRGCWSLSGTQSDVTTTDTPFHRSTECLVRHVETVFAEAMSRNGAMDSQLSHKLSLVYAALEGLAGCAGWLPGDRQSTASVLSYCWTGMLSPALQQGVGFVERHFPAFQELTDAVLRCFYCVSEAFLIHVTSKLSSVEHAAAFLGLVVELCDAYALRQSHRKKRSQPDDLMASQLHLILDIINSVLLREFELRLQESLDGADKLRVVEHIVLAMGKLLSTLDRGLLLLPDETNLFFAIWAFAVELNASSLNVLADSQLILLRELCGHCLFSAELQPEAVVKTLKLLYYVAQCSDPQADRVRLHLHLVGGGSVDLLARLLQLVVRESHPKEVQEALSGLVATLMHSNRMSWPVIQGRLLATCQNDMDKQRLRQSLDQLMAASPQTLDRLSHHKFESAFNTFVVEWRSFSVRALAKAK